MKRLRILTGRHVGAHLDLDDGMHVIGPGKECDIMVTDWTFAPLQVTVTADSVGCCWHECADADPESYEGSNVDSLMLLDDFAPREFDGIVICVGPTEGGWPSDVDLLSLVFAAMPGRVVPPPALPARRPARGLVLAAVLVVGAAAAAATKGPWFDASPLPVALPTIEEARALAQRELDRTSGGRLTMVAESGVLFITGLANDHQEAASGNAAVSALRMPYKVAPRFAVASAISETLSSATGLADPSVRYEGGGVFSIAATVEDEKVAQAAIDRIAADLAPAVKKVNAKWTRSRSQDPLGPILSHSRQDGLSVVQTRDGVKHIVIETARRLADGPSRASPPVSLAATARSKAVTTAHATSTPGVHP